MEVRFYGPPIAKVYKLIIDVPSNREEQHDDQILHELLRCFKALTLTPVSCVLYTSNPCTLTDPYSRGDSVDELPLRLKG